jgi:hypothetical protein
MVPAPHTPGRLDLAGLALSGACALHCLALPVLLGAAPGALGALGVLQGEHVEWAFVGASLLLGAWALGARGVRRHGRWRPVALFAVGFLALLAGRMAEDAGVQAVAIGGTVLGALLVGAAHLDNRAQLRRGCTSHAAGGTCAPAGGPSSVARRSAVARAA